MLKLAKKTVQVAAEPEPAATVPQNLGAQVRGIVRAMGLSVDDVRRICRVAPSSALAIAPNSDGRCGFHPRGDEPTGRRISDAIALKIIRRLGISIRLEVEATKWGEVSRVHRAASKFEAEARDAEGRASLARQHARQIRRTSPE